MGALGRRHDARFLVVPRTTFGENLRGSSGTFGGRQVKKEGWKLGDRARPCKSILSGSLIEYQKRNRTRSRSRPARGHRPDTRPCSMPPNFAQPSRRRSTTSARSTSWRWTPFGRPLRTCPSGRRPSRSSRLAGGIMSETRQPEIILKRPSIGASCANALIPCLLWRPRKGCKKEHCLCGWF